MDHTKTPILSALLDYAKKDVVCFDVPGHKRGNYLEELKDALGATNSCIKHRKTYTRV